MQSGNPIFLPRRCLSQTSDSLFRNIAIIAHVDHGKTTLVDCLLKQSRALLDDGAIRVMDSNVLEKERGITILSKATSVSIKRGEREFTINIVDTPGHSDFGGEVERVLSMVDGVALIVCSTEGPMTQTRFVLSKALKLGLKPVVVINKADRPTSRLDEVDSSILDLFLNIGANDDQMNYPLLFASAKSGWCVRDMSHSKSNMDALFDAIIDHIPPPMTDFDAPFRMLVTQVEANPYFGKSCLGRVKSGKISIGDKFKAINAEGEVLEDGKVTKIFKRRGLEQIFMESACAGDIVSICGLQQATVNSTLSAPEVLDPLPATHVDPPTISMNFGTNDSPFSGQEGNAITSNQVSIRLMKEGETNVGIQVKPGVSSEATEVCGRGELQLGVLIETMRRENSEISVTSPRVMYKYDDEGKKLEPIEEVILDVMGEHVGTCIEKLTLRKGELKSLNESGDRSRLTFEIPTRGLIGYIPEFKNDTRGTGVFSSSFLRYDSHRGKIQRSRKGVMISTAQGEVTAFACEQMQPRGTLFVQPGTKCYVGMIVGEHNRDGDIELNPTKTKPITSVRAASREEFFRLNPPRIITLEEAISYIEGDEMVEVTPKNIRLRKAILDPIRRRSVKRRDDD